jgi:hemerythrin
MDFLSWSEDYSVGVTQIDAQHKQLVGMISGLVEVMKEGAEPAEVAKLLTDLLNYTGYHFDFEEKLMERAGYAGLAGHRAKHAAMRAEVERLLAEAESGNAATGMKLMIFLKSWLVKHINGTDKLYSSAVQQAGLA